MSDVSGYESPAKGLFLITPGTSRLPRDIRAVYVGTGGDVRVTSFDGDTVTIPGVPSGSILPVRCTHVLASGTTASGLVGFV
jgi:hypothetical protein